MKKIYVLLLLYVFIRIILININYTEWGDTFRMIRGAEYLSYFDWPWDEKRWPFYSVLLVSGIVISQPVLWGRILSIIFSTGTLYLIYAFYLKYIDKNRKYALLAVILTATSSVFAYWSLRVMADVVFAFLIMLFSYLFLEFDRKRRLVILSIILLMLTMTRLEGLFMVAPVFLFFLIKKRWRDFAIFAIPQAFIYVPWTLYAKVLYPGPVQNDYLAEVQTFVFNFDRLIYFFTYTIFILVIPVLTYFVIQALARYKNKRGFISSPLFIVVGGFIFLEILIGFIWTPSLPRIYMPIIPFLVIFASYGISKLNGTAASRIIMIAGNLFLIVLFALLQFKLKLYFLGASKALFGLIIIFSLLFCVLGIIKNKYLVKLLVAGIIALNILISFVVINNQRLVYKTVKQGIEYIEFHRDEIVGQVAYSDETGNTEWYLRDKGFYVNVEDSRWTTSQVQYELFKENNIHYMLWTNEFNRGFAFADPELDINFETRYELLAAFDQEIRDPFDQILDKLGLIEDKNYTVYSTKVYRVFCECQENQKNYQ